MKDKSATIIVNLVPTEEKILEGLHKDARWGIGRAKREGLIVESSDKWTKVYPIYLETMATGGVVPQPLAKLQSNTKKLFVCKKKGEIIAAAGIKICGEIPTLYFNCSKPEFRQDQPNNLLYWNCIIWCKSEGYKIFDLGGWQINARGNLKGINKFKEKWGEIKYVEKDYPLHKAIGRKLVKNSKFFWWLNKKLRGRK